MAPLLLDRRYLTSFGIFFALVLLLCLAVGYYLGYQQGYQQALKVNDNSIQALELSIPVKKQTVINDIAENQSSSNAPGADIDVDVPDAVGESYGAVVTAKAFASITTSDKNTDIIEEKIVPGDTLRFSEGIKIFDNAEKANAKFSIQVGLYGNKVNAERKVDNLQNSQLSGYLTHFVNKKGDTLFNVRFGYFLDKESVLEALDIYQQQYAGDGYIVRLNNQ